MVHFAWSQTCSDTFTLREDAPQNCLRNGKAVVEVSDFVFRVFCLMLTICSVTYYDPFSMIFDSFRYPHVLKSVIKHFIFSVYFNKYAFLHLILLITFDRVHISQKAWCYAHQLIESFPVIHNMSRNTKKNLDSDIVDTYLHTSCVFSTFLPYRPIFLYYKGDLILELVQYK